MLTTEQRDFVTCNGVTCMAKLCERIDYDGEIMFAVNITSARGLQLMNQHGALLQRRICRMLL